MSSGLWSRRVFLAARCAGARTVEHPGLLTAPGAGLRVRDMRSTRPRVRYIHPGTLHLSDQLKLVGQLALGMKAWRPRRVRSATVGAVSHSHPASFETTGPIFEIQTAFDSTAGAL